VVAPISNDKLPTPNSQKAGGTNTKSTGSANKSGTETNTATAASEATRPADDTVNVDRASQLYRSSASDPTGSAGNINTSEEAAELATRISKQLIANGAQAMQAQAGGLPDHVGSLLSAAP
jgi:hypothetical protein